MALFSQVASVPCILMNLSLHKKPSKSASKARSPEHKAFDAAWNKVIRQQKANAKLQAEVRTFSAEVSVAIAAQERAYIETTRQTCEHLLAFCKRKSLSLQQREELLHWVTDYLMNISSNPFSVPADLSALHDAVAAQLRELDAHYSATGGAAAPVDASESKQASQADDLFDQLFGECEDEEEEDDDDDEDWDEELEDPAEAWFGSAAHEAEQAARQAEGQALKELMKSSSINKLFRKVAQVLHPDREPNEEARAEKNRLMGILLQARDANDIPLLFSLYAEYVGESPLREFSDNLGGITTLLQRQYEHLCGQTEAIIDEEPVSAMLYRRFHRKSRPAVQRAIQAHLRTVESDTQNLQLLRREVTTVAALKRHLSILRRSYMLGF